MQNHAFRALTIAMTLSIAPIALSAESADIAAARGVFSERQSICDHDRPHLWGRDLCGPILFVDEQSRRAVADRKGDSDALRPQDGAFVGQYPSELTLANTALDWDGVRWTMVVWPLPEEATARRALLMHESFHRIQQALGLPLNAAIASDLATTDGRIGLRLEWRALAAALTTTSSGPRKRAVADALAFRSARRAQDGAGAEQERLLEMNEGLAEYTGQKFSGAPNLAAAVAESLKKAESWENYARRFAYASGPAYGLLLDRYDPQWRAHVKSTDDLGDLLARAAKVQPTSEVKLAEIRYRGDEVRAEETALAVERDKTAAMWSAKLVSSPTLRLPIADVQTVQVIFDPRNLFPLPPHGTVYPTLRISDAWGTMEPRRGLMPAAAMAGSWN
jgi:hypothetical protein